MTSTELNTKITILYREHITTSKINGDLHEIRKIANKVIHDNIDSPQASAISIHQLIYNVTRFFYEKYNNTFEPVKVKPYSGIDFKKGQMDIDEIQRIIAELQRQQDKLDSNSEDKDSIHEKSKIDFKNYKYTKINGSYLNGELYKLKDSSQEAVESLDKLTDFKKYLHVERDIQNELKSKIEESVNNDTNKLILLCGSVGDGKSHLLSYLIETYPDLMNKFEIINDATESSDPNKTSIDRLSNKLIDFNDENINKNNKKLILSINLGVLNNFIESDYAKKDYIKLSSILNELNIFDVNDFSNNFDKDPVSIISFSDNNLFEFNLESNYNVSSKYMSELFNRITQPSEENPFYNAFCKDLNNNLHSPIIYNYSLFSIEEVQDVIINNLIKIIIKYKKIISTRELLNFIYEIIVPSYYEINSDDDSFFNYMTSLLPNLFFNTTDGCEILKFIHYEDPINKRSNIVDQLLMDLNVSDNMLNILEKYIELDKLELFKDKFNTKIIIRELKEKQRNELVTTIIRILNIFGKKEVIELFTKESYKDYVNYLIHYNKGEINQLRHLRN